MSQVDQTCIICYIQKRFYSMNLMSSVVSTLTKRKKKYCSNQCSWVVRCWTAHSQTKNDRARGSRNAYPFQR